MNVSPATLMVWRILMQTNLAPDIGERRRVDQSLDKNERIMKANTHGQVLGYAYEQRGWSTHHRRSRYAEISGQNS